MFIKAIFFIVLPTVLYAQNTNIDNTEQSQNTNIQTNVREGGFFDILPVNDDLSITNEQPAFIRDLQNSNDDTNITTTFIRAIIGFVFFFFLLYLAYRYLKKRSKMVLGTDNIISVLATTPISQNKHLSIVEVSDHIYFISVTDKSINLLSEIEDKDTKDMIRIAYSNSSKNIVNDPFFSIFDKMLIALNIKRKNIKSPLEETKEIKQKMKDMDNEVERYLDSEEDIERGTIRRDFLKRDSSARYSSNVDKSNVSSSRKKINKTSRDKN